MSRPPSGTATAAAAALLTLASAAGAAAQQPAAGRGCTLTLQPTDSTESVSRKTGDGAYVTRIRNGMTWLCGAATMTADSAVQYEARREVLMVGSVHYRDTTRDLRSRRLTYFRDANRVLAEDSVRLRQLATGAVLRGPRVEFYNAVSGQGTRRTVATGRPRTLIPSPDDTAGAPFRVRSDTTVFVGEERAEAFGDVVVRRDSLTARGGYARFRIGAGTGFLTRSPVVEGEEFTLSGDTIRVGFRAGELRTVRARGDGRLRSDDLEVRGPRIDVRVRDDRPRELWAHGGDGAEAYSAEQAISGDSLHFDFVDGRLAEIAAVGRALAVEARPGDSAGGGPPPTSGSGAGPPGPATREGGGQASGRRRPGLDRDWMQGDTVRAIFAAARRDSGARPDSATGDTARSGDAGSRLERLVAAGNARSFYRIRRKGAGEGPGEGPAGTGRPAADSARTGRNYVIGDRITVRFREGEPLSVEGRRAIGVFLEPVEEPRGARADTAPRRPPARPPPPDTAGDATGEGARSPRDSARGTGPPLPRRIGTLPRMTGMSPSGGMVYE